MAPYKFKPLFMLALVSAFPLGTSAQTSDDSLIDSINSLIPAGDSALQFNQLFNVGGIGDRDPGNFVGSVGCGGGTGGALSAAINASTGEDVADRALSGEGQRDAARDLWRYCDNLTTNTFGWTGVNIDNGLLSGVDEERLQSSALAPDELFAQIDQAAAMTRAQLGNVGARLRGVRLAALGIESDVRYASANGGRIDVAADGSVQINSGLNAGDALGGSRIGFFANGRLVDVSAGGNAVETGSDTDGFGITAGIDYAFTDSFIGGIGIGYTDLETEYDGFGAGTAASVQTGDSAVTNFAYQVFFSYFPNENLYFDGVLGFSQLEFDFQKNVPAFDQGQDNADAFAPLTSSPDGDTTFFNLGVGYDIRRTSFTINPYVRVEYLNTEIDGFTEQSTSADNTLALTVAAQDNTSLTTTLGATVAWPISASSGVYMPYVRGEFVHEFDAQADDISGFLAALPDASFTLTPAATDENYGYVGAGLAATFANEWAAFADFDTLVGFDDLDNWQLTLGFRKQF